MIGAIASIAAGGALGSVARYGVNVAAGRALGAGFPYGTMIVNILGAFLIGGLVAAFAHFWQPPENARLFVVTGFLGGFTTFSAFSLDFAALWERHDYLAGALYVGGSVVLSVAALFAAMALVRGLAS